MIPKFILTITALIVSLLPCPRSYAENISQSPLLFNEPAAFERLANKDIQSVCQGRDGDLWICTRSGLFQYDGYSLACYKSGIENPGLLTSNNILCAAEDDKHRLWIGTYSGLNVLDLTTGAVRKVDNEAMNGNTVSAILVTRKGRILLATDWGLYEYEEKTDNYVSYTAENTGGVLPKTSVKSLLEDDRGDIWIGTWNEGLFRHESATGRYYRYPRLNEQNSAHVLFQDKERNIWVGTWRGGLTLLKNAWHAEGVKMVTYRKKEGDPSSLSDDIVYALAEDAYTGDLWIGTRRGLSILPDKAEYTGKEAFRNFNSDEPDTAPGDEVTSLLCDKQGLMWIGTIGGGMAKVDVRRPIFGYDRLPDVRNTLHTASVRSMLVDDEGLLWLGIGSYGFGIRNRADGSFVHYPNLAEFAGQPQTITTIMSIMQRTTDKHVWLAAYDDGVYEIDKKAPAGQRLTHYSTRNVPWLAGDCVYQVMEDAHGNLWFATRNGVSVRKAAGGAIRFDDLQVGDAPMNKTVTVCMSQDADGRIWCGSSTQGIFCLEPDRQNPQTYTLHCYNTHNGKFNADEVNCLYADGKRIWAGTGSSGLNVYDPATDGFIAVHQRWGLPGDAVLSIRGDRKGNLWLGTNAGLVKLMPSADNLEHASFRLYTKDDGLQGNIFNRGASTTGPDGELFFGGHQGYNSFFPDSLHEDSYSPFPFITDIRVKGRSWHTLPLDERRNISPLAPRFAEEITLDYRHNNFSIEFSAMDYINPSLNLYTYKLDGFDQEWQVADATKRIAYYNNLNSGTYTFHLRVTNSNGSWSNHLRSLQVVILPPPWQTWWAYTLYILATCTLAYGIYRTVRNRVRLRNAIHVQEMEKAKVEEMNHVKLQFFTNVTHELLTPLTILLASVSELKRIAPAYKEQYRLMNNNINRLIRLLQQILEFRKAETGNLKLKVSSSDLALFVRRGIDSFRPLMRRKDINFSCSCHPEPLMAYFDPDKVDKILYNLLSNASKYNQAGGLVCVDLFSNTDGTVRLVVRDDGPGISKSAQKDLFKRFYEGDYRKYNTIGTGIGLSLVRDLVELHHGTIEVESEEGKGASFIVTLPIRREAYSPEETDEAQPKDNTEELEMTEEEETTQPTDVIVTKTGEPYSLLLVEDNGELLLMMTKLLQSNYKVYTASNGKEALEVLQRQEIDLIVTDAVMPEMDGLTFCREVKAHDGTNHIPIILLTAKEREEDRADAYDAGVDAFIAKPFDISVLQSRIANLLLVRKRMEMDKAKMLVFNVDNYEYTSSDKTFLQECINCVNRHMSDPKFSQTHFLEEMHISRSTLFRRIKQLTGLGFTSFVANIRIKTACRILDEKKQISISEVANLVGYNDAHYFSVSFKKIVGMSPTEYAKRLRDLQPAE